VALHCVGHGRRNLGAIVMSKQFVMSKNVS